MCVHVWVRVRISVYVGGCVLRAMETKREKRVRPSERQRAKERNRDRERERERQKERE